MRYNTHQREQILNCLRTGGAPQMTAVDICRILDESGEHVGRTTVYRQLERLVEEKLVARIAADGERSAAYVYIGPEENGIRTVCFHCKCVHCGALFHINCPELADVYTHLSNEHDFTVNPWKTIIYGICRTCRDAVKAPVWKG